MNKKRLKFDLIRHLTTRTGVSYKAMTSASLPLGKPNRATFLSRRLKHRGTEAKVAPLLRALCASVVILFGMRTLAKRCC